MKKLIFCLGLLLAVFAAQAVVQAQTINGNIAGTVTDSAGAAISGATVTVSNEATGFNRTVQTDEDGGFRFSGLQVATYSVRVEKAGFGSSVNQAVLATVGSETDLVFQLQPGSVEAIVNVTSAGEVLETSSGQVQKTISQQQILELPGRNSLNGLALLNPGVLPNQNGRPGSGFAVNGNRTRSNNFTIDGANNNDQSLSIPRQSLPSEALEEFTIVTNTPKAEFGRNAGSYVNQITRSGTNELHGTGFYAWQGNGIDSLTTNQQRCVNAATTANLSGARTDKQILRGCRSVNVNQVYGGTVGGPIKKDHTFFFTSYDRNPIRTTIGSAIRPALDAASRAFLQANRLNFRSPAAVDYILATFPVSNDPTVQQANTAVQNATGTQLGTVNFLSYNRFLGAGVPYGTDFWRWLMKVNTRFTKKDNFSVRYLIDKFTDAGQPASLPGLEIGQLTRNDSLTFNDSYVITSNIINEARFTYSRRKIDFPDQLAGFANGAQLTVNGAAGAFNGGNANFPQNRNDNVYEFTENLSWTMGDHGMKFGYNLLKYDLNSLFAPNSRGAISYSSLSNFLNDVSNGVQNAVGDFGVRAITYEHSMFAQDDWRVNPDLTVNLGIRYEYVTVPFGYFSNAKADTNNFSPRLGAAWNPKNMFGGRMVLRAGFGISYDQIFQNILLNVSRNYPRVVTNSLTSCTGCQAYLGFANIPLTATTTTNLPQQGVTTVNGFFARTPGNLPASLAQVLDYRFFAQNERVKSPQSMQWTVSSQYQLARNYVFKAEYIGTKGSNLVREVEQNYGLSAPLGNGLRTDPTRGSIVVGQGIANSIYHSGQFTFEKRPSAMSLLGVGFGESSFNLNYTYSSFISESDDVLGGQANRTIPADPRNPGLDRARSGFDQPHRFVFSSIWHLPGMKGYGDAFIRRVLGGWQLSQVSTFASGVPFSILNANNAAGITSSQIATVFQSQRVGLGNPNGAPNSFTVATGCVNGACTIPDPNARYIIYPANAGIFGSLGANTERTPSTYNTDVRLGKSFRTFGETQRLQLSMDVFNVFNRRNFTVIPSNTLSASSTTATFLNYGLTNVAGRTFTVGARYQF